MLQPAVKALHHFNAQCLKYNRIIPTNARKIFGFTFNYFNQTTRQRKFNESFSITLHFHRRKQKETEVKVGGRKNTLFSNP